MTPNKHALIIQCRRSHKPNLIHSILQRTHTFISLIFITSGERRRKESGKQKLTTTILNTIAALQKPDTNHGIQKNHIVCERNYNLYLASHGVQNHNFANRVSSTFSAFKCEYASPHRSHSRRGTSLAQHLIFIKLQ